MPAKPTMDSISLHGILAAISAIMTSAINILLGMFDIHTSRPSHNRQAHPYQRPKASDDRSPCPALNALANHGYLPRNGRFITHVQLVRALREGYGLSLPLATFLSVFGHVLLEQGGSICLHDLARHNYIEHNASLGHADTIAGREYATCRCDKKAMKALLGHAIESLEDGKRFLTPEGFARARVEREATERCPLDGVHEEIARGECAMVLGIFGQGKEQVPVEWIEDWWIHDRLPDGWVPSHEQGLFETVGESMNIKTLMTEMKDANSRKISC